MYGGNMTYPSTKVFFNTVPDTGALGKVYDNNGKHFLLPKTGDDIAAGSASYSKIENMEATKRVALLTLDNKAPNLCGGCVYEYGFTVRALAKEPGVNNSLPRGASNPYFGKTDYLPTTGGLITDEELDREAAELTKLIRENKGELGDPTNFSGGIVDAPDFGVWNFADTGGSGRVKIWVTADPAGAADIDQSANDIDALIDAVNAEAETEGHDVMLAKVDGTHFVVFAPGGGTIRMVVGEDDVSQGTYVPGRIMLITKEAWYKDYSFIIEGENTLLEFSYPVNGNFAVKGLTSDDVYRTFAHMKNDRGFANMTRDEKPIDTEWMKFIVYNETKTATIAAASHGENYMQVVEIYIPVSEASKTGWLNIAGTPVTLDAALTEFCG